VPTPLIERLFAELNLDRLSWHQTTIDTTIIARDVNKGTGLTTLLDWVGLRGATTVAAGDSESDLAMFRVAGRSFAPPNISCARSARFSVVRSPRIPSSVVSCTSFNHWCIRAAAAVAAVESAIR
jgi:hypothetical protein